MKTRVIQSDEQEVATNGHPATDGATQVLDLPVETHEVPPAPVVSAHDQLVSSVRTRRPCRPCEVSRSM